MAFSVATVGPFGAMIEVEGVINDKYVETTILIHCLMKSLSYC